MNNTVHLNRTLLEKEFQVSNDLEKKVRITHKSGYPSGKIRVLPYSTKDNELKDAKAVIGNFLRHLCGFSYTPFGREEFNQSLQGLVDSKRTDKLLEIINEIFFDDNNNLLLSHPMFFKYLNEGANNEKKVSNFLINILSDPNDTEIRVRAKEAFEREPEQVLLALVHKCLPRVNPQKVKRKDNNFKCIVPEIQSLFREDLLFLLSDAELVVKYLDKLIFYYYFFYISQTVLELDAMFESKTVEIQPVYYNLNWEKRSSSRDSYKMGWKMINSKLYKLFSHVNCIMMINHIENPKFDLLTYRDVKELVRDLSLEEQVQLASDIKKWRNDYEGYLGDVDWTKKKPLKNRDNENVVLKEVRALHQSILYQFQNSGRKKPSNEYYEGFTDFANKNFLKQSGSLGYTLNLTQEYIIFLTKLCVKDKKKMLIKDLFKEFEKRGIFFDRGSRKNLIELYEKLNILEKKSDSGDAQYVKYIL